jgi:hypothetical protein
LGEFPSKLFDVRKKMAELNDLNKKQRILSGWLADYKQRSEQLPYVQQSLDLTNYQLDVVLSFPVGLPPTVRTEIVESFSNTADFWQSFAASSSAEPYPLMAASGLALEASGSNVALQSLSAITVGYPLEVKNWAREKTVKYQDLQDKQHRDKAVEQLISRLLHHRLQEFSISCTTFASALAGAQMQSSWGINARNLLEHIKGDLFAASQKALKQQKVRWAEFADALARGGVGSAEHSGLLAEEATHRVIHSALTGVAKNLCQLAKPDLRDRRTELHDHLFTVLSLIDESIPKKHS